MLFLFSILILSLISALLCYFLTPLSPFATGIAYLWFPFVIYVGAFIAITGSLALFAWLFSLVAKKRDRKGKTNRFGMWFCKELLEFAFFFLGGRVKVTGKGLLPKNETFIVVSNHLSAYDVLAISCLLKNAIFVSKPENFALPIAGGWMNFAGYVSLERDNPIDGLRAILKAAKICEEGKANVVIFPEGTRSKDHHLQEFKPGSFKLATASHKPLVIIAIRGSQNVKKNFPKRFTRVHLDVLKVYRPEEIAGRKTTEICDEAHALIGGFLQSKDAA